MTVFVGVRNNYLIWRYGIHASCSIFAALMVTAGIIHCVSHPKLWIGLTPLVVLAKPKGRKLAQKCIKEVHDGVLFSSFGVFETDSKKRGSSS